MWFYDFIHTIFTIIYMLLIARVLLSWFRPAIKDKRVYKLIRVLYDLTEPILEPIRRRLPAGTMLDFSPFIAVLLLNLLERLIIQILW